MDVPWSRDARRTRGGFMTESMSRRHHVVVIGSGFGGLFAAKRLKRAGVDVTLISRTTHHLFQPLLYQVATGILSEGEIAPATREILRRRRYVKVLLGEVTDIDLDAHTVVSTVGEDVTTTHYDSLIVAAGATTSYFGHDDEFQPYAPGLNVEDKSGTRVRIPARTIVWAAGVQPSPLGRSLAEQSGAETDRAGRVKVQPDCSLPGHPEVFVIGDMMTLNDYPGVAQVAMQQGKYAADQIRRRLRRKPDQKPFHYFDKGSMATISRFRAVANIGPFRFAGFIAWLLWLAVHVMYLVGFKNRVTTVLHWAGSLIGRR